MIVWRTGQTPAKRLLGMRTIDRGTLASASWWRMLWRQIPCRFVIDLLAGFTLYIPYFWLCWDKERQQLWDKMADTLVVNDFDKVLDPRTRG